MDNICHTLVGAALGEAGFKQRTQFGNATLMIAANLPDIDVLVFATGTSPVAFRRGWTHGVLAQLVLPFALTALMVIAARLSSARRRGESAPTAGREGEDPGEQPRLRIWWILGLSFIGIYSHVFLDYLNNYGVRLLAPIDWRWFYGDSVFIVDVWLWAMLGAGVWLARQWRQTTAARGALVFAACYVIAMLLSTRVARDHVRRAWIDARGVEPRALMVGPLPLTPFSRQIIVDSGDRYETGSFSWQSAAVIFSPEVVPKNHRAPEVAQARDAPRVREFLVWSRFPYWQLQRGPEGTRVTVKDMRFGDRFSASVIVPRGH